MEGHALSWPFRNRHAGFFQRFLAGPWGSAWIKQKRLSEDVYHNKIKIKQYKWHTTKNNWMLKSAIWSKVHAENVPTGNCSPAVRATVLFWMKFRSFCRPPYHAPEATVHSNCMPPPSKAGSGSNLQLFIDLPTQFGKIRSYRSVF